MILIKQSVFIGDAFRVLQLYKEIISQIIKSVTVAIYFLLQIYFILSKLTDQMSFKIYYNTSQNSDQIDV